MRLFLLFMVIVVAKSSADCGCLKCSKHLQGVDIPGPNGSTIKVVFKRPCENDDGRGRCYTARIEAPLVVSGPVRKDCHYQQCCNCGEEKNSAQIHVPYPTQQKLPCRLLNNLKYRCDTVLVPTRQCADVGHHRCRHDGCSNCDCCSHRSELNSFLNNFNINNKESSCSARNKRSTNAADTNSDSPVVVDCTNEPVKFRNKRDLAQSSYKFLMGMLPQFVRDPLHHGIQGTYVPPKPTLKDKIDELKLKKLTANLKPNYYDYEEAQPSYHSPKKFNHHWASKFDKHYSQPKYSPGIYGKSKLFGTSKPPSMSYSALTEEQEEPFFNTKYKYGSSLLPKFSLRTKQSGTKMEEAVLLRKLKKLNGNPFSTNINDQANDFMQDLIKPDHQRSKRSVEELKRQKRTIILSSNEIDLPPHYEVDFVSVEDDELENTLAELEGLEEDPIVGNNRPFLQKYAPSSKRLFPLLPKPEVVMGKNVIKQAVRDELNAYHKKVEQEQKIKEIKTNMERRKKEASIIPHNPIFLLLTAPMKFLKHFRDINKGVNPVMTSLPKLVYTTKKYFRDFGKNFQKNCLNLASDVVGDFDHVPPQVIQRIQPSESNRYKRECEDARESDGRVNRNVDDDEITIKEETKQLKDEKSIEASLKPESVIENKNSKSFLKDTTDSSNPRINSEDFGYKEDAAHKQRENERSLLDKFLSLVKDLLDPKLSLSPNDSIIESDLETDDVKVKLQCNSDPLIKPNTEKNLEGFFTVSGETSASDQEVDSGEDAIENNSGLRSKESIKSTLQNSNHEKIIENKYDCRTPLSNCDKYSSDSKAKLPANKGTNEDVNVPISVGGKEAVKVEMITNKNIEDCIASNGRKTTNLDSIDEIDQNKIVKELSGPLENSNNLKLNHKLGPQYSLAFENSKETENFQ